jgi:hypothetical protein
MWLESGGWMDQPAWYTEAMNIIEGEMKRIEAEAMKRNA